jgi:hypothetical protein
MSIGVTREPLPPGKRDQSARAMTTMARYHRSVDAVPDVLSIPHRCWEGAVRLKAHPPPAFRPQCPV